MSLMAGQYCGNTQVFPITWGSKSTWVSRAKGSHSFIWSVRRPRSDTCPGGVIGKKSPNSGSMLIHFGLKKSFLTPKFGESTHVPWIPPAYDHILHVISTSSALLTWKKRLSDLFAYIYIIYTHHKYPSPCCFAPTSGTAMCSAELLASTCHATSWSSTASPQWICTARSPKARQVDSTARRGEPVVVRDRIIPRRLDHFPLGFSKKSKIPIWW